MDDLSRSEYPSMLANLQPGQAVQALQDRLKRINKINVEIAEWLQERRKVEEQYVAGLRKLLLFKVPNTGSELGVFQGPWDKILQSADAIAASHHLYAQRIEKDVELPLRNFHTKKEMVNIGVMSGNLQAMAKELEEAQEKSDKLNRKGGKANVQKLDMATTKLDSATSQWDSQVPFIFETLQMVDEQRINHLRDVLTQLETHEVDQATRTQAAAEDTLNIMLEVNTEHEIQSFVQRTTVGRPKLERKPNTRQSSVVAGSTLAPPPATPHDDDISDHSGGRNEAPTESRLRSRIGTMLGRRRQSIHGGFGQLSPGKSGPFGRGLGSSHGRTISPRASSNNLAESNHRLSSLAERPGSSSKAAAGDTADEKDKPSSHEGTNGVGGGDASTDAPAAAPSKTVVNGSLTAEDIFDAPPPESQTAAAAAAGQQQQQLQQKPEAGKDSEGFTIPAAMNDPISQAQREALAAAGGGEETDQLFRLNIQSEPVAEEDADAKQAAMSNVANTLSSMPVPSRKTGTVRGRRDVRNTIYVPAPPLNESSSENNPLPVPSPALPGLTSKPSAVAALASEASIAGTSDTQSVRSATSLGSLAPFKHPDMHGPGLNSSIIETVSATFEGKELKAVKISGEIAFSYNPGSSGPLRDQETIRLNNFAALEVIGPNRIFVQNTPQQDEFTLDTSHIQRTSVAFTYRPHADEPTSLAEHCPLAVEAAWKSAGDRLQLLLQYRLNPAAAEGGLVASAEPVRLHNVVFVATYEGARASGAQTRPAGTHLKDKHLVYWRLGDVTLTPDPAKIVCRVVGEQGAEPRPGHVEVRWEYTPPSGHERDVGSGISVSRLQESKGKEKAVELDEDDPFADDSVSSPPPVAGSWVDVPLVKKLVSGRYEAK